MLGPALFSLALQPVLLQLEREFPTVKIFAYMDDVSLVADDHNALKGATERLTALALVIGLRLNKTKTVAFGPFGKSLAEQLGITHDPLGLMHQGGSMEYFTSHCLSRWPW